MGASRTLCQHGRVNPLFASHDPDAHGVPLPDAAARPARADDLAATGALAAQREGGTAGEWTARHERRFADTGQQLMVAEHEGRIVGYGWVSWLTPAASGGRGAPDGWYLAGVVVDPAFRRRGLGRRLTEARVDWVLERADDVHYVVSGSNRASRDLHAFLGFVEVTDDFVMPGVVFTRDDGILCTRRRRPDATVIDLETGRRRAGVR